jgi:polynucleotide kinase-phosphatase
MSHEELPIRESTEPERRVLEIPALAVVCLVGVSGSGKSTFARHHFLSTEVLSSDFCRGLVSDDENDQKATKEAFDVLHYIAGKRLAAGRLVVIDATNVQPESRRPLVALARAYHAVPVAIVINATEELCVERNASRSDRNFGGHVIRNQMSQMRRGLKGLRREGFRHIFHLSAAEAQAGVGVLRVPLWTDRRTETGPFDIVGDIHGCFDELCALLRDLGYVVSRREDGRFAVVPPEGRRLIFLGDLVDRGPDSPSVLRLTMDMVAAGQAIVVPGNHDAKLVKALNGRAVKTTHGLAETLEQLALESAEFREEVRTFLDGLVSHFVLDGGRLVVAHAGMKAEFQGRASGAIREFALYGETTGETDEFGLPVRYNWASDYRGEAMVVYGHTPVPEPEWLNRTINIDTGCVFGGALTALRYPERQLVRVEAARVYCEPAKPLNHGIETRPDDVLDIGDVSGKRFIQTRLNNTISVQAERATAALESMSRFSVAPNWLAYLSPTMAPTETSMREGYLEYPEEAFSYYAGQGVERVVCQEKHMGSRAVLVVCRDAAAARRRFGAPEGVQGSCYTRTGRPFFHDAALESRLIEHVASAAERAGLWEALKTDWLILDCELMPWSAKAGALVRGQYAAVGAAANLALTHVTGVIGQFAARGLEHTGRLAPAHYEERLDQARKFRDAYRRYCWPVNGFEDLKLAPFHLLASEGAVHTDKDHGWHMDMLSRLVEGQEKPEVLMKTNHRVVDLADPTAVLDATAWWEALTEAGGEGMVVKPWDFVVSGRRGLVQPALKCRGREYLRIIYGPEYAQPEHLTRLRKRGIGRKRSLALREFALGIEALERFVRHDALYKVHECVFAVLALECEPVDPRL